MTLKQFERLISKHKEFNLGISELYDLGFDLYDGKFKSIVISKGIDVTGVWLYLTQPPNKKNATMKRNNLIFIV